MIRRAFSVLTLKAVDDSGDKRVLEGIATTPEPDSYGDIVVPDGAEFSLPIPFLWQHNSREPIGTVTKATVKKTGITVRVEIAKTEVPGKLKERLDEAWESLKIGLVTGLSIGFNSIDAEAIPNSWGIKFLKWRWLELSAVTIPANAGSGITAVKAAFGHADPREPGATGKIPRKQPQMKLTLADNLARLEAKQAANVEAMEALLQKAADANTVMDDADQEAHDALATESERIAREIGSTKQLLAIKAAGAKPAGQPAAAVASSPRVEVRGPVALQRKHEPGVQFARLMRVKGLSFIDPNRATPMQWAKGLYPDDEVIHGIISKAAVAAGTTTQATWAAPLVGDESAVFADFVEFLRPTTILGRFGAGGIPSLRRVPFRTRLVGQTSGGSGYWVGEGAPKPVTKFDFSGTSLAPNKVANIAVLTMELLRDSSPSAELIVRDQLAAALRERLDIDFIDPAKAVAANVSPASVTNGVSAIASSGNTAAAIRTDIRALMAAFIAANNAPTNGVFIMTTLTALALSLMQNPLGQPEFPGITMNGGTFFGMPVITSEYVPTDTAGSIVVLANASDIYFADDGDIAVDMSMEASLQMLDNPTNNPTGSTVATSVISLWQTNCVGFRAERTLNWVKRRASAVAVLDGVNWGVDAGS
jgi:HK97 family phage prohead protease